MWCLKSLCCLLVLSSFSVALENGLTCFEPGQCLDSLMLDLGPSKSSSDCLHKCQDEVEGCEWFTYYKDSLQCISLTTCLNLTKEGCTDCISGEKECPEPICNVNGKCLGALEGNQPAANLQACHQMCLDIPNCGWFSYNKKEKICQVTADCPVLDKTCLDCVSSEGSCEPKRGPTLFVVGGDPESSNSKTEAVDLSGEMKTCNKPIADFKYHIGSVGTFIDNKIFVCGGMNMSSTSQYNMCFIYKSEKNEWENTVNLTEGRDNAAAILLNETHWWVTGGLGRMNMLKSTEIFNVIDNKFSPYVDLPNEDLQHKLVRVNDTHIMMMSSDGMRSYLFNQVTRNWTTLPVPNGRMGLQTLGMLKNGSQIAIVAGGYRNTSVGFDFKQEKWVPMPELPIQRGLDTASEVQFEDSFLIVGGHDGHFQEFYKSIIMFDTKTGNWTTKKEHLQLGRANPALILIPEDINVIC